MKFCPNKNCVICKYFMRIVIRQGSDKGYNCQDKIYHNINAYLKIKKYEPRLFA